MVVQNSPIFMPVNDSLFPVFTPVCQIVKLMTCVSDNDTTCLQVMCFFFSSARVSKRAMSQNPSPNGSGVDFTS